MTKDAIEIEEVDQTEHDMEQHNIYFKPEHSKQWYDFWGGKCPVCDAIANVTKEEKI